MDDSTNKRLFYLGQALKKVWKEYKRLCKSEGYEEENLNKPFENIGEGK